MASWNQDFDAELNELATNAVATMLNQSPRVSEARKEPKSQHAVEFLMEVGNATDEEIRTQLWKLGLRAQTEELKDSIGASIDCEVRGQVLASEPKYVHPVQGLEGWAKVAVIVNAHNFHRLD